MSLKSLDANRALRDVGWVCAHLSESVALEQFWLL
jgi:hypothetical protein